MTTATASHDALARWLVSTELGDADAPLAAVSAAERVFHKLSHRLTRLITSVGCEALVARAVHLSRARFPFLEGVQITQDADAVTLSFRNTVASVDPNLVCEGFLALLGTLIALLVSFIGEDLMIRVLRDVWPDIPMIQPLQHIHKNGRVHVETTP